MCDGDSVGVILDGTNGTVCTMKALTDKSGYKIICDGDSVGKVVNGTEGSSCTRELLSNKLGYKLVCNGDSVGEWYDELGLCTELRESDIATQNGSYFICQSKVWATATVEQYDHYGQTCTKSDSGTVVRGVVRDTAYYFCNGTKWSVATIFQRNTYGLPCNRNGELLKGLVVDTAQYVCEKDTFRVALQLERNIGLGCVSYTADVQRDSVYSAFAYGVYDCKKKSSTSYVWELSSYEYPDTAKYETITDERDNKVYKIVKIGSQTWMAENLNFSDSVMYPGLLGGRSSCYEGFDQKCEKYGRLYHWSAAMDSAGVFSTNGKNCGRESRCTPTYPVRGICPEGWHLPNNDEWNTLFAAVGGSSNAGIALKSRFGWDLYSNNTQYLGRDVYGFLALPAGKKAGDSYVDDGKGAFFWSSSEEGYYNAYNLGMVYSNYGAYYVGDTNKGDYEISVRCIKDAE